MQQMMDLTRFHHHHHSKSSTPLHHSMGHHPHPHPSHQHSQSQQQQPPGLRQQHHATPPSYPIMNPSLRDEREGCRSLICDANGIIIAEMVFRCMICSTVSDSIGDAKIHYHTTHIDTDDDAVGVGPNGHCPDEPLIFPDEELDMESSEEDDHHHQQSHHGGHLSYQESRSTGGHYRSSNSNRHAAHHHGHGDSNDPLNLSLFDSGLSTSVTQPQTTRAGRKTKPSSAVKAAAAAAAAVTGSQATPSFSTGHTTHGREESSRTSGAGVKIQTAGTNGTCTIKSGYITCPVCNCTKFYTTLQRRYGQFSCVGCYRFFKEFFVKPKRFGCPNLGSCSLDQRTKCKACWIKKCIDTYTVDDGRRQLLLAHRPVKKNSSSATTPKSPNLSAPMSILPPPPLSSANGPADVKSLNNNNNDYSMAESITCEPDHSPSEVEASEGNENNYPSEGEGLAEESEDVKREEDEEFSPTPAKKTRSSTTAIDYGTDSNLDCGQGSEEGGIAGEEEGNSLDDVDDLPLDEEADNNNVGKDNSIDEGSSLLLRITRDRQDDPVSGSSLLVDQSPSDHSQQSTGGSSAGGYSIRPTSSRAAAAAAAAATAAVSQPRRKTSGRIKNWCCLKCANCLADDCGKCINCLDRPKFGGPFIRKQRCLYKKCLMKTKPISSSSGNGSQEHGGGGSLLYD